MSATTRRKTGQKFGLTFGGGLMMTMLMLVGAVLASLALGVLVAYGICLTMFRAFRFHAVAASKNRLGSTAIRAIQN